MDDMIVRMEKTKDGMSVLSDHSFNTFPVSPTTSQIRDWAILATVFQNEWQIYLYVLDDD